MAIDKSNSKPWVKTTVWILTIALTFSFMGIGVTYLIANWRYLFGSSTYEQDVEAYQQQQAEPTDEEYIYAYESQIADLESQFASDPTDQVREYLAGMSAGYAAWLYNRGDVEDFPRAIELIERAIELDPDNHETNGRQFIDQMVLTLAR